MPYELVDRATNAAHVIPPRGAWLTIGREPPEENDVVRHEQEVSRRHAQLHEARDGVMLRVLSPNGVYKRGERGRIAMDPATGVEPEFPLHDGDQFSLLRPGKFDDDVAFFVRHVSAAAPAPPALVDLTGDDSPAADPTPSSRDAASEGAFAPPAPAPRRASPPSPRARRLRYDDASSRSRSPPPARDRSPSAEPPVRRRNRSPPAARARSRSPKRQKQSVATPLRTHVIDAEEGTYSQDGSKLAIRPAPAANRPHGTPTKARLTLLSWNLGSEQRFRSFQRDVIAVAATVNAAWARAKARGAGLVVAFQEFDLGPRGRGVLVSSAPPSTHTFHARRRPGAGGLRTHRLLSQKLDDELEWAALDWLDETKRERCEALLVSRGAVEVVDVGRDVISGDPQVCADERNRARERSLNGFQAADGTFVAPDPDAAGKKVVSAEDLTRETAGRTFPWAELRVRARGGRAGAPPAAVKIAACHVRNGDRVMRADARRWLRANGRAPGRVAAILAGDFNDDLTAASRADSDYARSLCRVLWPRRAAGNENYPEAYWVHENNRGEKTRKYDPRAEARDAGFDHRGWGWGSYHGYHGLARFYDGQFVNKGRIIDGAMCFGESESVRCDAARLVTDGFDYADIDEDAGEELAAVMRHAPSDHFPVQTDLTLRYF